MAAPFPPSPLPPPFGNLPFGTVSARGEVFLTVPALQFLQELWAAVSAQTPTTFAQLTTSPTDGALGFITDSLVPGAGNFGTPAAGGGTEHVPVYYDANNGAWMMG